MGARRWLWVGVGLLVVVAAAAAVVLSLRVPRPDLPYPPGQELSAVRGNCLTGNELLGCGTRGGPRSFLTVQVEGGLRESVEALFGRLSAEGWNEDTTGLTARDQASGGAPEDLQPVYCKQGCVALFRFETDGYVLAWFDV